MHQRCSGQAAVQAGPTSSCLPENGQGALTHAATNQLWELYVTFVLRPTSSHRARKCGSSPTAASSAWSKRGASLGDCAIAGQASEDSRRCPEEKVSAVSCHTSIQS